MLARLGDAERKLAFFAVWTRKETILKASGGGLSVPLDSFTVSLEPVSTVTLSAETLPADASAAVCAPQWTLLDISPAEGARAALPVEGDLSVPLQCRQLILPR